MGLKDLLVHVDNDPACNTRVDVAVALAAKHGAHLTGLHVLEALRVARLRRDRAATEPPGGAAAPPGGARPPGRGAVPRTGTPARDPRRMAGRAPATRRDDEALMPGTPTSRSSDRNRPDDAPHDLGLPAGGAGPGRGAARARRPTLRHLRDRRRAGPDSAWNGSREATRAVHDALPLLTRATKVTVLSIDPARFGVQDAERGHHAPPGASRRLGRSGLDGGPRPRGRGRAPVSRGRSRRGSHRHGAYGHSRVREMVLGGATRTFSST